MLNKISAAVVILGLLAFTCNAATPQPARPDQQAAASRTLKVKLSYAGAGKVDDAHKIFVFLFDSPDFTQGSASPIGRETSLSKDSTLTFSDVQASPVYIVGVYDPEGKYDGESYPPGGCSVGMYSKTPGVPEPIKIEPGKTGEVELTFDDTNKTQ